MCKCNDCKTFIEKSEWQGIEGIRFAAGGYEAFIMPGLGANLVELKDTVRGLSLMRNLPDVDSFKARPHVYGIPVLFPPNRIAKGTFKACGKVYNFPVNDSSKENHIHGFLRHRAWEVTKMELTPDGAAQVEVTFKADKNTDFFVYYPHEFEFKLTYRLSSKGLEQKASVTNNSSEPMPMGLGFHTALNVPFHPESKGGDCSLKVSVGEKWELNDKCMPTGKKLPLNGEEEDYRTNGVAPLGRPMLEHFSAKDLTVDGNAFNGAIIEDTSKGLSLVYEVGSSYKHWMIWNDTGDKGFICPEPQTWVVDAPNLGLPDAETGLITLAPGGTWEDTCKIYIKAV